VPEISVIVPSYGRPERLAAVVANIREATACDHEVLIVAEPEDRATRDAAEGLDAAVILNCRTANYAGAVNTAAILARGEYLFAGSDDLRFHPGWDAAVLGVMTGKVRVGGTNDLLNPYVAEGRHATHYLVDRRYVADPGGVWDEPPGLVLKEAYSHQFTDCEFIGCAKARGVFAPCLASVAEHLHYQGGRSQWDATYARGQARIREDEALFRSREPMWADELSGAL
jgi:glycosyltransferase involved in cell wall biosynthesis